MPADWIATAITAASTLTAGGVALALTGRRESRSRREARQAAAQSELRAALSGAADALLRLGLTGTRRVAAPQLDAARDLSAARAAIALWFAPDHDVSRTYWAADTAGTRALWLASKQVAPERQAAGALGLPDPEPGDFPDHRQAVTAFREAHGAFCAAGREAIAAAGPGATRT